MAPALTGEAMTTNQTLDGVHRDTLDRALNGSGLEKTEALKELRALLDAPAKSDYLQSCEAAHNALEPAPQPQGEPVERIQYDDDDAQAAFEVLNPMPRHVTKFKGGYAATEFNAWDAHEFCKKWDGFKQCAKLYANQPAPEALTIPDECPHLIVFDDTDRENMMFAGLGARPAALKTWEKISMSWNAHLFVRVDRNCRDDRYPSAAVAGQARAV